MATEATFILITRIEVFLLAAQLHIASAPSLCLIIIFSLSRKLYCKKIKMVFSTLPPQQLPQVEQNTI